MPHLLIAGSTGSGKSVMLNAMIMSFLYKATPDEVRMIMVDPKRVELGIYEGIPHLLTPVITEPKKATNALTQCGARNGAAAETARRARCPQYRPIQPQSGQLRQEPRRLFDETGTKTNLAPLPYILILIDELADLMILNARMWRSASRGWPRWRARSACTWCLPRSAPAWMSSPD